MIYEDFNRPKAVRLIENISFTVSGKKHSLGLMQVQTKKLINDKESVELGVEKIYKSYKKVIKEKGLDNEETIKKLLPDAWSNEWSMLRKIISNYNKDEDYLQEINMLTYKIFNMNTKIKKTHLFPGYYNEDSNDFDY